MTECNRPKIKVVDSVMGSGKTSFAIQKMNETDKESRFLYVTPFLDEIERIKMECPELDFVSPERSGNGSNKSDNLVELLRAERNVAFTHALFRLLDEDAIELIETSNYTLLMDEVMEVLKKVDADPEEIEDMIKTDVIRVEGDGEYSRVQKVLPGSTENLKRYASMRRMAEANRLVYFDKRVLMWLFPSNVFEAFDEVWNLCYLFDGSYQKAYYDVHGIGYEFYSVVSVPGEGRRYQAVPWRPEYDAERIAEFRQLVDIYEGKLNRIGQTKGNKNPLSWTWYRDKKHLVRDRLRKNLYNYFRNNGNRGPASEYLWCAFKDYENSLKGKGYSGAFLSKSIRSTNSYSHTKTLAYLINIFLRPEIRTFFKVQNVDIDEEQYALSEMVQWIWRSRIRNGKPIKLYVPSSRMRALLKDWLGQE